MLNAALIEITCRTDSQLIPYPFHHWVVSKPMNNGLGFLVAELTNVVHSNASISKTISHPNTVVHTSPNEESNARECINLPNPSSCEWVVFIPAFCGKCISQLKIKIFFKSIVTLEF